MHYTNCLRHIYFIILLIAPLYLSRAQERDYLAIIPTFHDRLNTSGREGPLRLQNQQFVLFVYQNAVAVYSEADFINTGTNMLSQEFGLPSTGHDENGILPGGKISTGILSVRLWVQGKIIAPDFIRSGNEDWYTIRTQFAPGERKKIKALFWAETSLTDIDSLPGLDTVKISDGKRGFMFDLAHAAIWNGSIETISINIVLMQGLNVKQEAFSADPNTYQVQDSTLSWKIYNAEPTAFDNIFVWYSSIGNQSSEYNTMSMLSNYIVKEAYDNLINYVRKIDEK
jgi:hypothetical protein